MRVALNGFFWDQPNTGSGQYLHHLWAALHERTARSNGAPDLALLKPPDTNSKLPRHAQKLLWEEWGVAREAARVNADLLHVPYLSAPLFGQVPTVVTAHDMIPWVVPGYSGSRAFRLYLALAIAGVRRARLVMADSEASRRDAIRVLRLPPSRVHTVYLGVEPPPHFTPEQLEEVRARFGLPPSFAYYMGGFDRRKNVPLLLRAWREVVRTIAPDGGEAAPVLAIGGKAPTPGGIFPDVPGEAAALGFGGESSPVRFLGYIAEEDKPLLMAAARLFVYPSAYEGFGLDPLEAMSLGTPVVSSSGGSLAEVVGAGGLLVPPDDETALSNEIARVWNDPALRQELAHRGRRHAARFTWERTAQATQALYAVALQPDDPPNEQRKRTRK